MSVTTIDAINKDFMIAGCYAEETYSDDMDMSELIEAHLDYLEDEHKSAVTIKCRRRTLKAAHRDLPNGLDNVYTDDIKAYLANPDWSRWTIKTYYTHLVGFYRWAAEVGEMTADPTMGLKAPPPGKTRPKPITNRDEIWHALDMSPEPWHSCIMLGLGAGLRSSELAAIRREDITPEYVHVRSGKGDKERYVDTCHSLWEWVQDRPGGLLVRNSRGQEVTGEWLSARQRRHWISIGLPAWHLHRLRHTFCTTMWRADHHDPLVIRDLMGHESVETTTLYAEADRAAYRQAVAAVDVLLTRTPAGA